MSDVAVRVFSSVAAALIVYGLVTASASLALGWRVTIACVAAIAAWFVARYFAVQSKPGRRRVASGIRGRKVRIEGVTAKSGIDDVASDVKSAGDVVIKNIKHEGGQGGQ